VNQVSYKSLFDLTGKNAIVTGGAGILGEHFCAALAEHGANIAVVDIELQKALDLALELKHKYQVKSIGIQCDVSKALSVQEMLSQVILDLGEINILHNNAGAKSDDLNSFFAPFEEYNLDCWREIMSVNLDGMFLVAQIIGKQMLKQGKGGSIIQTSSIYGILAPDQRIYEGSFYLNRSINTPAVYSASKAGVIGLTRYLATYWADQGIRVNSLTPGGVESGQNKEFQDRYSNRVPLKRMAKAHEIAGALAYLASDASSYVTGENIVVDGGLSAW